MKYLAIACSVFISFSAYAQEPKTVDAIDLSIDFAALQSQTIIVTGCNFSGMSPTIAFCTSISNGGVNITIDGATLEREALRRLLKECKMMNQLEGCNGAIKATVGEAPIGGALLLNGTIAFEK